MVRKSGRISFEESQRFREIAVFVLLAVIQLIFIWGLTSQVVFHQQWGIKPAGNDTLVLLNLLVLLAFMFFYSINLRTEITDEYVSVRMFPYQFREKKFFWRTEIREAQLVKYDFFKEKRQFFPFWSGRCYAISGCFALKLFLKNGKVILIGTHKPEEISEILDDLISRGILETGAPSNS